MSRCDWMTLHSSGPLVEMLGFRWREKLFPLPLSSRNTIAVFSVNFICVHHVHLNLPEDARSVKSSTDDGIDDTTGHLHQDI